MSLLSFRNVWVEYGDKVVLERVSLDIEPGEFVSVVGPSGAGKSTFLRLVLGQEGPSKGSILFEGQPMAAECSPERGVVFQRYSVFPHLTALQNVLFGRECVEAPLLGKLFGGARKRAITEAADILAAVGLENNLKVYPAQMSGGMQQRLAVAQALIKKPRVLLLDEPFGALDAKVRKDLRRWLRQLHDKTGHTTLFVTHDQDEAFELADRIAILNHGKIEQVGTPAEILGKPATAFVADFIADVSLTVLKAPNLTWLRDKPARVA